MTGKQVKSIMIASVLIIGGVLYFGKNRRKKLLYAAITAKVNKLGGTYQGGSAYNVGANISSCTLSQSQATQSAERVYESLYSKGLFGWGTDENLLFSTLRQLPSQSCLAKVNQAYNSLYNKNMDANIKKDLKDTPTWLEEYEKIVTQEIPAG